MCSRSCCWWLRRQREPLLEPSAATNGVDIATLDPPPLTAAGAIDDTGSASSSRTERGGRAIRSPSDETAQQSGDSTSAGSFERTQDANPLPATAVSESFNTQTTPGTGTSTTSTTSLQTTLSGWYLAGEDAQPGNGGQETQLAADGQHTHSGPGATGGDRRARLSTLSMWYLDGSEPPDNSTDMTVRRTMSTPRDHDD